MFGEEKIIRFLASAHALEMEAAESRDLASRCGLLEHAERLRQESRVIADEMLARRERLRKHLKRRSP